ncbi:MAG: hypothetical protein LQ339_005300 [Xanthoria mediterranea]|nr:MAG: hypothetical protein LQ339_005300 [Xanthoria mediterranea]
MSSSSPSTPDSRRGFSARGIGDSGFGTHPTTTPAGPPPSRPTSSTNSFTPAGPPPPSSILGNSQIRPGSKLNFSKPTTSNGFSKRPTTQGSALFRTEKPVALTKSPNVDPTPSGSSPAMSAPRARTFAVPDTNSPIDLTATNDDDEFEDDMDTDGEDIENNSLNSAGSSMRFVSAAHGKPTDPTAMIPSNFNRSLASPGGIDWARSNFGSSIGADSLKSTKRNRESTGFYDASYRQNPPVKRQKKESVLPGILHDMSRKLGTARLQESDALILASEACVGQIYQAEVSSAGHGKALEDALPIATKGLCSIWRNCRHEGAQDVDMDLDVVTGIGPNEGATNLQKAIFVAPLLLQMHHPPPITGKQAFASSRSFRPTHSTSLMDLTVPPARSAPIPRVLHDWLEEHHNPYASAAIDLQIHAPNPTAHTNYWDILFNLLLRGKMVDVIQTLRKSDFQHARTAREANGPNGYDGIVVKNIKILVNRMASVFDECPILQEEDWDITGNGWSKFRKQLEQALADLTIFVEGTSGEEESDFEAPNFGIQSTTSNFGQSVRNAERQIPSLIYENLKTMYGILLGKTPEIVSSAQDWVEATLGLTLWWDGQDDDDENLATSFIQSRRSSRRSQRDSNRTVDFNPIAAYVRRLAAAFERVTDEDDPDLFQINSNNAVEVALASVFEGNVEGVMEMLKSWSLPTAAGAAEIANLGGWFVLNAGAERMNGFDQSDLMVLSSHSRPEEGLSSDGILIDYASALFERPVLGKVAVADQVEGWEIAMQILSRLDDEEVGIKKLSELLQQLPLTSDKRVDRLLHLCQNYGLDGEAAMIAERYADHFTNETEKYGNALIYYARARRPKRVKNILDLLISLSLVESKAVPPSSSLDDNLRALLESPKESLAVLRNIDVAAAQLLHHGLTGYASLRRFYELRDAESSTNKDSTGGLRPNARRKAAVSTLVAVINSAADNIHGGLYDEHRGCVVPIDGLLTLLGEAFVFVNQSERDLSLSQCLDLLKAVEDLQTVTSRVYEQCEECFRCTVANVQPQQKRPDAREMLKKSISNMTSSSSAFSLIESTMMGSDTRESTGSEGVMVNMVAKSNAAIAQVDEGRRGWDWRKRLSPDTTGADLLRMLRLGLAKDIARAWVEGEEL